LRFVVYSNSA